jgi:2-iminoacetate synthase
MFGERFRETRENVLKLLAEHPEPDESQVKQLALKAELTVEDACMLAQCGTRDGLRQLVIDTAAERKKSIWNNRLFLVPPLYVSDRCADNCVYCPYRKDNRTIQRIILDEDTLIENVKLLSSQGYRVIELVAATDLTLNPKKTASWVRLVKEHLRSLGSGYVGLNFFPFATSSDYELVVEAGLDFAVLWQETYDPEIYKSMHPGGTPKSDMQFRLNAFDRMMQGGLERVGAAFLGGLGDWKYDLLMCVSHGKYLEAEYGHPPFIIGTPRFKSAPGTSFDWVVHPFGDQDWLLAAAIYKLVFPRSLPWFSTREWFELSAEAAKGGGALFTLDCSTEVGGYTLDRGFAQFPVYSRSVDRGTRWLESMGFDPQHALP